jgi:exodeoxyribonuclease VII large subunit
MTNYLDTITEFTEPTHEIFTVSELNFEVKRLLEENIPFLWVEGEISTLRKQSSGHIYFTLKDPQSQVRCAMFRSRNQLLNFAPREGMLVLVQARATLYLERGDYQLIVEQMQESGDGALRRAFEMLKNRLAAEGLFAQERKKIIPSLPKCVGVITSPTGAAIHDILSVLKRRFPVIPVIIYPTQVQGSEAVTQVIRAIKRANARKECDVLILARGGGSLEDLWTFNEEKVARAIAESEIPIVSGVGHEIDVTIADFVADHRAATPSAAAEFISPNANDYLIHLKQIQRRIQNCMLNTLHNFKSHLLHLSKRLQHPGDRLQQQAQRLDDLSLRLQLAINHHFQTQHVLLAKISGGLKSCNPLLTIQKYQSDLHNYQKQLLSAMTQFLTQKKQTITHIQATLTTMNPQNILQRGYAIVSKQHHVVESIKHVQREDILEIRLADGSLETIVTSIKK